MVNPTVLSPALLFKRTSTTVRGLIGLMVKETPHLTLKEFSDLVGRDPSALSKLVDRIRYKVELDPELSKTIESIKQNLKDLV